MIDHFLKLFATMFMIVKTIDYIACKVPELPFDNSWELLKRLQSKIGGSKMWAKLGNWFKNFFGSIAADPQSTISGLGKLAAAGAAAYGMSQGVVPINSSTVVATAGLATSGIVSLGTNNKTGQVDPTVQKIATVEQTAATAVTQLDPLYTQVKAAIDQAGANASAAAKVQAAAAAVQQIAAMAPPATPPQV